MKKFLYVSFCTLATLALAPVFMKSNVHAADIRVDEPNVTIDEYVDDDLYVTGSTLEVNEDISGDLIVGAGQVTVNDDIYGNALIAGGTVQINGDIRGSLVCVGGQVTIDGHIYEDANVWAGMVNINGDVEDDVRVGGGVVYIKSENIGGDLFVGAGSGSVSTDTTVAGDSQVQFGGDEETKKFDFKSLMGLSGKSAVGILLSILRNVGVLVGWLLVGYFLFKYIPIKSRKITDMLTDKKTSVKSLAAGALFMLSLIVVFPVLFLLMLIGVGQPMFSVFTALLFLSMTIAGIYSSTGITRMIIRMKKPKYQGYILPMVIGVSVYQILGWIPWIFCCMGLIVKIVITTWGIGGILVTKWDMMKKAK